MSGDLPVYGDDPACWSWKVPPFVTREWEDSYWLGDVLDRGPRPAEPWPARTREDALRLIGK